MDKRSSHGIRSSAQLNVQSWAEAEVAHSNFKDKRLGKRFRSLLQQLTEGIGKSIPFACQDWANTKAAYRFLSNPRVSEEAILSGHCNRSLSGVLPPPGLTRKNPPSVQSGGTRSDQRDDKQQQAAAA